MAVHSRDGRGMRLAFIISLTSARLAVASPAEAAKRFALVIGNNAYENVPQLQKAVNDADAIAAELSKLGFDVVKAENVGRRAMSRALVELEGKIAPRHGARLFRGPRLRHRRHELSSPRRCACCQPWRGRAYRGRVFRRKRAFRPFGTAL